MKQIKQTKKDRNEIESRIYYYQWIYLFGLSEYIDEQNAVPDEITTIRFWLHAHAHQNDIWLQYSIFLSLFCH